MGGNSLGPKVNKSIFAILFLLGMSSVGYSKGAEPPTFRIGLEGSPFVHKSGTINGTDFGGLYRAIFETYSGAGKNFGMSLTHEHSSVKFTQTEDRLTTEWSDFAVLWRVSVITHKISLGTAKVIGQSDTGDIVNAIATTWGTELNLDVALSKLLIGRVQLRSTNSRGAYDKTNMPVKINGKNEFKFDANIKPLEFVGFKAGYGYTRFGIGLDDGDIKTETQTGPYFGVQFDLNL